MVHYTTQVPPGGGLHGHHPGRAVPEGALPAGFGGRGLGAQRLPGKQEPGAHPERNGLPQQEEGTGGQEVGTS